METPSPILDTAAAAAATAAAAAAAAPRPPGRRSWLFTPGNHARRVEKVFQSGADVAILDLEDAVAPEEKVGARGAVVAPLQRPRPCAGFVRVNGPDTAWCYGDLQAVVGPWLDGLVIPKTEAAQTLRTVDWLLTQLERERGLASGALEVVPLVETARGVLALEEICAASPRVRRIAFGGGDYTLDLRLQWTAEEGELAYARARLAHCSRVAGLEAPIDTVELQIRDPERFRRAAARARQMGFQGKLCIHPDQVPLANEAFAPTAAELAQARAVVAAFAQAEAQGVASIQIDGLFVDAPVAAQARRVLALAGEGGR